MSTTRPLGVGILGAGPVTQAIHLPTLARLPELFEVVSVMDVDPEVAAAVATRVGARASGSLDELLSDERVEVVAVCSPPQFHADQVIAVMNAGKLGVLCEKPFATTADEARAIAEVSERTGVPVIVGAMHVFDPGWRAVRDAVLELSERAHTVRSSILIPFNDRFEDWATEVVGRPTVPMGGGQMTPERAAAAVEMAVLGLSVHDLPLVRTFLPQAGELAVMSAQLLQPFGYVIEASAGDRNVILTAGLHGHWQTWWEFEVVADDAVLTVRFTPSYVHGGSATASLERSDTVTTWGPYPANGYENEWRALASLIAGDTGAAPSAESFIADLEFTVDMAKQSSTRAKEAFTS